MNCLNDETIQAFLDKELNAEEKHRVEQHMQNCPACMKKVEDYAFDLDAIMNGFSRFDLPVDRIAVPSFREPTVKKRRHLLYRAGYYVAAAVALLVLVLSVVSKHIDKSKRDMEVLAPEDWVLPEQSSNQQWQERQVTVVITDKNGNIIDHFNTNSD